MEPKQAKAAEADQFSSLPVALQDDILVRLDIRDAVRTSVLCRAWGGLWKSMSVISISFPSGTQPSAVDSVLLAYIGPRVSHFGIYVEDASADRVDDWLVTLSHRPRVESVDMVGRLGSGYFDLHSSIFSFRNLVSLRLRYCTIPRLPVGFTGFPVLQKLFLISVDFSDRGADLEAIIRRSPLLSALDLSDVLDVDCLIEAPNLRSLILYIDEQLHHAWRIGELPCLEDADISVTLDPPHQPHYGDFLARFAHVQKLTLFLPVDVDDVERMPSTLAFSFYNLKNLKLSVDFTREHTVSFMFTLLRSCHHNLQNLEIELRGGVGQSFEADWEFLNAQWTDGMCAKLQVVRMIHTAWLRNEISLMKLMLSKSRLLCTLYVGGHPRYFNFPLTYDLLKSERASAEVRVLFEGKLKVWRNNIRGIF